MSVCTAPRRERVAPQCRWLQPLWLKECHEVLRRRSSFGTPRLHRIESLTDCLGSRREPEKSAIGPPEGGILRSSPPDVAAIQREKRGIIWHMSAAIWTLADRGNPD